MAGAVGFDARAADVAPLDRDPLDQRRMTTPPPRSASGAPVRALPAGPSLDLCLPYHEGRWTWTIWNGSSAAPIPCRSRRPEGRDGPADLNGTVRVAMAPVVSIKASMRTTGAAPLMGYDHGPALEALPADFSPLDLPMETIEEGKKAGHV
ncbi:MAG: hypothetical protein FD149_1939 [Rhodospirillaceae bacterium]|nr:MAG: hypothetical protein FD149_1939 [Rhodospirillaceae bacterium]